jgi:hypothetical protein
VLVIRVEEFAEDMVCAGDKVFRERTVGSVERLMKRILRMLQWRLVVGRLVMIEQTEMQFRDTFGRRQVEEDVI